MTELPNSFLRLKTYFNSIRLKRFANVLSLGVIILFFIFNVLTPLVADDYYYSLGVLSISDVAKKTYGIYFNMNGRIIVNFLVSFWLFIGKSIFNIANTAIYCLFIYSIQFHIMGKAKHNPFMFLAINIFLWFFVPAWGENFLWVAGSCGYLWTATFILLFLIPFRKKQDDPNYKLNIPLSVLFFFLGLLAGCNIENAAAAIFLLLIFYFAVKAFNKRKMNLFEILGTLGFLIGFLLLIFAPGTEVRMNNIVTTQMQNNVSSFMILRNFLRATHLFVGCLGYALIAICAILAFDLIYYEKRKLNMFSYFYALAAIAGTYSMIFSPFFPPRAFLIVIVFSGITLGNILFLKSNEIMEKIMKKNTIVIATVICCLIGCSISFLDSSRHFITAYMEWNKVIKCIQEEKAKGNFDIELRSSVPYAVSDKHVHTSPDGLGYISHNKDEGLNTDIAKYFGLSSIKKLE